jgi:acyl-CoA thioesterase-1
MASVKRTLFLLSLFSLAACLAAAQPDSRPRIVVFGDSLSAGFGAGPGQSFPDFLQQDLDKAGYHYRVINQGVSGDTTSDGVTRIGAAIAEKPAIVILELGGNDGLRGIPIAKSKQNLDEMIRRLKAARCRILLAGITLPPNYGPDYIKPFQQMYQDLAAKYHLPLIPFLLADVVYAHPELMQHDGIHPTAQGNEIVARTVLRKLEPMLKK